MEATNRLEELVERYANTLLRAAAAILGDPCEAEDAVQDTSCAIWKSARNFGMKATSGPGC